MAREEVCPRNQILVHYKEDILAVRVIQRWNILPVVVAIIFVTGEIQI